LQTPKKNKRKRKKVKMAILKYYKVDSDGKIKRLRRECPTAECGAGIFVGLHFVEPVNWFVLRSNRWLSIKIDNTAASAV